jgi:membrane-associated phospholipid phosphatase
MAARGGARTASGGALVTVLALALSVRGAAAQESAGAPARAAPVLAPEAVPLTPPVELVHDWRVDVAATAALTVVVVVWRFARDPLEPSTCRWCDGNAPGDVNGVDDWFRRTFRHGDTQPANVTSYVLAFGVAPVSAAVLSVAAAAVDRRTGEAALDVVAVAEGGLTAMLVTEILEPIALRMRPYVHATVDDRERAALVEGGGAFHSFPAGHVVETFGVAAASGVIASMRGYRLAPLVWVAGMTLGVATAYTRVAADRHYFTDTLAGAAIGTLTGAAVPLLFHRPVASASAPTLTVAPIPHGRLVGVSWPF